MRFLVLLFSLLLAAPASAQEIRTQRVSFPPGAESSTVFGVILGREIVDFLLNARAGQYANVGMATQNPSAYFNILAPGETEVAFFVGSTSGNQFEGRLPATGDYRIRVYQMRNAARRGETADYRLEMIVSGGRGAATQLPASPPDGFVAGDFFEVTGVGGGDSLNLRDGPGTSARIVGRLANGAVLRNVGGCRMTGQTRWCEVETTGAARVRGWVSARYLREPRPGAGGTASQLPASPPGASAAERAGQGRFDATGAIPCKQFAGQPTGQCRFGVARAPGGSAAVVVTRPDGGTRALFFEGGRFVSADTSQADGYPPYAATRDGDVFVVTVGAERYEIFDAVVFGG
ncbi:SH3 domain-containing protein [Rubrimonas cliftonensis]|uniref:SH3 domain-containing protein n=1 Tax=Rubrimonas cliftonensis TaxID=89524 RepID=A0A1H4FPP8_9RHOB|nr:SH3 domain-containing protein [Rubrimonas cliftonensis]SEA99264.1 SH3 domain-containing protein [Rubrimonas cliftonensis]